MAKRFTLAFGLTIVAFGTSLPAADLSAAQASAQNPCGLLTSDEVQALVPEKEHASSGMAEAIPALESFTCRYTWGEGVKRYTLAISVNPVSRTYSGMNADAIKQGLTSSIKPETTDATIPDIGEAAVFKADSAGYAGASAYVKDRLLQVHLDGFEAREKKGQLISLLKSAASRL